MSETLSKHGVSPRIAVLAWGRIELAGGLGIFRDAKLYPGGAREWDWRETGTRHVPGIQPQDVEELLERGCRSIVLATGMEERLRVRRQTKKLLEDRGVVYEVLPTRRAVERYNELTATELVGALIHSTC